LLTIRLISYILSFCFAIALPLKLSGQEVAILNSYTNGCGQIQIEIASSADKYYILYAQNDLGQEQFQAVSLTIGEEGSTILTEPSCAFAIEHYKVEEYALDDPGDVDKDGINDLVEFQGIPAQAPFNNAKELSEENGVMLIDSFENFKRLSKSEDFVQWSEFLNGKTFVKYMITDFNSERPHVYFINSSKYDLHADFAREFDLEWMGDNVKKGQVIYHPSSISSCGELGVFAFNYSNGRGDDFVVVERTFDLLAANMPLLENNLAYFITEQNEVQYESDLAFFDNSRVKVLFESETFSEIDYWGLNPAEGFGFFRLMSLEEIPEQRDIVLYNVIPNTLPRVAGIITSAIQTPLSHVNLRAIQDNIPNAFLRDPMSIDSVAALINKYIYFKVEQDNYYIREASQEEVNLWFEDLRPIEEQEPNLNLDYNRILPLDSIQFEMADGFGAKCANLATMRSFGFPTETIPNGFGVPFYFYQEFMIYNGFFDEIKNIIEDPQFISDRNYRNNKLKELRDNIRQAEMPDWMAATLDEMHKSFPENTSIRCRSSTNNEDLPGFNGAGLYTSKTHHPDEGHISKTIKQVFAGLWNLRAYDEREFQRVDHFLASMAILCHPNFKDEKANGVAVSTDPLYNTHNTFYLNSQIGEDLITNPDMNSIPEEILLDRESLSENDFIIIQRSNLIPSDTLVMNEVFLDQLREYLTVIHDEFELLYNAEDNSDFAMDIEFKITKDDILSIKQARPWVSFNPGIDTKIENQIPAKIKIFPNPTDQKLNVECTDCDIEKWVIRNVAGRIVRVSKNLSNTKFVHEIDLGSLNQGIYLITGYTQTGRLIFSSKFVKGSAN